VNWPWNDGAPTPPADTDYTVAVDMVRRCVRIEIAHTTAITLVMTPVRARKLEAAIAQALAALGEEKE